MANLNSSNFRLDHMLRAPGTPAKTANDQTATPRAGLAQALDEATQAEKTAAQAAATPAAADATPVEALAKMAEETLASQDDIRRKQAALYGQLMADEVIARLGNYEKLAGAMFAGNQVGNDFAKVAAEQPELLKQAAEAGYEQTHNDIAKLAAAYYDDGVQHAYKVAHEVATSEYVKAAAVTNFLLRQAASR
jgi:hypothetical protein